MRLQKPSESVQFATKDIYGEPISLEGLAGKPVMLSFFEMRPARFVTIGYMS